MGYYASYGKNSAQESEIPKNQPLPLGHIPHLKTYTALNAGSLILSSRTLLHSFMSHYIEGLRTGRSGFDSWRGNIIVSPHINTGSGTTELPIQWVPEALSQGVKWLGRDSDHSPPSSADVKSRDIPPFPTRLQAKEQRYLTLHTYTHTMQFSMQPHR
jgi:hypothetical protein